LPLSTTLLPPIAREALVAVGLPCASSSSTKGRYLGVGVGGVGVGRQIICT
jgi:hypothetical protein